jgi:transposase-like protein
MVDHIVDATAPRGRVEIRSGVGRRRRWSDEDKGRIVAESYAPGAVAGIRSEFMEVRVIAAATDVYVRQHRDQLIKEAIRNLEGRRSSVRFPKGFRTLPNPQSQ